MALTFNNPTMDNIAESNNTKSVITLPIYAKIKTVNM